MSGIFYRSAVDRSVCSCFRHNCEHEIYCYNASLDAKDNASVNPTNLHAINPNSSSSSSTGKKSSSHSQPLSKIALPPLMVTSRASTHTHTTFILGISLVGWNFCQYGLKSAVVSQVYATTKNPTWYISSQRREKTNPINARESKLITSQASQFFR